jgi:hypothetical protein
MGDPTMYKLKVEEGEIGGYAGIQFSKEEGEENTALKDAITPLLKPPAQQSSTVQQPSSGGGRRRKRRTKVKSKKRSHRRKRTRHQH